MQKRVRVLWEDPALSYRPSLTLNQWDTMITLREKHLSLEQSHLLDTKNWSQIQGHLFSPNPTLSENKIGKGMLLLHLVLGILALDKSKECDYITFSEITIM